MKLTLDYELSRRDPGSVFGGGRILLPRSWREGVAIVPVPSHAIATGVMFLGTNLLALSVWEYNTKYKLKRELVWTFLVKCYRGYKQSYKGAVESQRIKAEGDL